MVKLKTGDLHSRIQILKSEHKQNEGGAMQVVLPFLHLLQQSEHLS